MLLLVGDKLNTRTLLVVLECLKDRAYHIETVWVWVFGVGCQHEACGEQDFAVWSSPLAGVWVFGAGCQHEACREQDLSVVWSSPPLVVVWVFGAGCQHEACGEQDFAVWSSPLAGVWVFGAGCQHEACREQDLSARWFPPGTPVSSTR